MHEISEYGPYLCRMGLVGDRICFLLLGVEEVTLLQISKERYIQTMRFLDTLSTS